MAEPERCFSIADLCAIAYPQFDRWSSATERKYRVVVRSAARRVARRLGWSERRRWGPGDPLEFVKISRRRSTVTRLNQSHGKRPH
jgi:hypothetical protein